MHADEARDMLQRRFDLLSLPVETAQLTAQWMFESAPNSYGGLGWSRDFVKGVFRRAPMVFGSHPERLQVCAWSHFCVLLCTVVRVYWYLLVWRPQTLE